jgi:hypothetical protein
MNTSAQVISFRDHARQAPAEIMALENTPEVGSARQAEDLKAANNDLAQLIKELRKYIPNYARI